VLECMIQKINLLKNFIVLMKLVEKLKLMKHLFLEFAMENIKKQEDLFGNSYQINC